MNDSIMVSVICNAYNHEKYIRDALDGFVMQKTDFKYEVLVHDDASTDNTANIIREYEAKFPDIIKPIYQTENQYSKGLGLVSKIQHERALGKYIAICEGDDFWVDPYKLQKQYNALEQHPEVDMCAHRSVYMLASTGEYLDEIAPMDCDGIIPLESVIAGRSRYIFLATASFFFRKSINDNIPEFRKNYSLDYTLSIHGALRGGILYLNDLMSVYRYLAENSWTQRQSQNSPEENFKKLDKRKKMYEMLDKETNYKYTDIINETSCRYEFYILRSCRMFKELKEEKYKKIIQEFSTKQKVKFFLEKHANILLKIRTKIKLLMKN